VNDLEEGVYNQYKCITDSLVGEIKETNRESCKVVKMLICVIIVLSVLLAATNMAWLYMANQYEYVEYEQENMDGINSVNIGEMGT
jgi:Tfp pilus assembly protein PilO